MFILIYEKLIFNGFITNPLSAGQMSSQATFNCVTDLNDSLNILRKVVGDSEQLVWIINSGWVFQPLRVNVLT